MRILGVDPGLKHTGWALIDEKGKDKGHGVFVPPLKGKQLVNIFLGHILPWFEAILTLTVPHVVVIEEVQWYGKGRKIMLPLAHVAGALAGLAVFHPTRPKVYLLLAHQRGHGKRRFGKAWQEHDTDAFWLAQAFLAFDRALAANDRSYLRGHAAVGRRSISVEGAAPGPGS